MKPVEQTILHPPRGNCFAACVASILELGLDDVPNPHDPKEHWWDAWHEWLNPRGLYLVEWDAPPQGVFCDLPGYWIATVPSMNTTPKGGDPENWGRHCIVMHGNEIAHDPAPSNKRTNRNWREGDRIFSATVIVPFDPAPSKKAGRSCE